MLELRVRLPRVPAGLGANLLGLLGLIGFALAVGGLTHNWWWSGLIGSAMAVGLAYIAQLQGSAPAETPATSPVRATEAPDAAQSALDEHTREVAYIRGRPATATA